MKYQAKSYWCGPASIQNAMRLMGKTAPSQKAIAEACGTSRDGTDEFGIMRGLKTLGLSYVEHRSLTDDMVCGLVCLDDWSHWCSVYNLHLSPSSRQKKWLLVDPERTKRNKAQNGVYVVSARSLLKRASCSYRSNIRDPYERPFYAIEIVIDDPTKDQT